MVTMRTMTAGIFQLQAGYLAPEWQAAHDVGDVNIKFVLSDSRVHCGIIGMRWPEEVERNVAAISGWKPPVDFADLPRWTGDVYKHQDGDDAGRGAEPPALRGGPPHIRNTPLPRL